MAFSLLVPQESIYGSAPLFQALPLAVEGGDWTVQFLKLRSLPCKSEKFAIRVDFVSETFQVSQNSVTRWNRAPQAKAGRNASHVPVPHAARVACKPEFTGVLKPSDVDVDRLGIGVDLVVRSARFIPDVFKRTGRIRRP
ncbi:hypothetical protein [Paraburkholderia elongata]|uniref:Uncharacterized protein n=1 Tax=Paraburkholderia elongata TaxID=2675747 RepID=A0A972SQU1_9BURK|nr:hypothetical protein [Paraburkholderia elongata]NPT62470.1 hypothetical protein [Paraburkholderia elongata]